MQPVVERSRVVSVLPLGVVIAVAAGLVWYACWSPRSRFLLPDRPAAWIEYPVPPSTSVVVIRYEQQSVFRRSFELSSIPTSARLRVRAFERCSVAINGQPISLPGAGHWSHVRVTDVAEHLHPGTNDIRAIAANEVGPPVLWLIVEGPGFSIVTDPQWDVSLDGAAECPAHRAGDPFPLRNGNAVAGGNHTVDSLRACWPELVVFVLLSAAVLVVVSVAARCQISLRLFGYELSPLTAGPIAAMALWVVLFAHNLLRTPLYPSGFDATDHIQYVQYIQEHGALPLAEQGWEMHHPPLFYLLAAVFLRLSGVSALDPGALVVFRLMGLAAGLTQLGLVAGCLRLLFPAQPRRQLFGLVLAAFLPAHIYTCHYVTNEALLMALGTGAVYLCLRILRDDRLLAVPHALLGLCLGAALLSKVTAVVVAGVVVLVLAGRLVGRRDWRRSAWLRTVGMTLFVTLVVSGWHYGRVWAHYGTPFVGNYDAASGFWFWQPPGHATFAYLFRFGQALVAPFFSALTSLPDGLYSTLWGDGLCGGVGAWPHRPPWNYDLMAAGFLLALLPSLAIVVGLCLSFVGLVRRPQAQGFLLFGVAGGLAAALLFQFLRYPYYGHARASYLLIGMVPLCAFGAVGLDLLDRGGRLPHVLLAILFGLWACTAYMSFWIDPSSAIARNWEGDQLLRTKRYALAEMTFRKVTEADPHFVPARINRIRALLLANEMVKARSVIDGLLRDEPNDADALVLHAFLCHTERRIADELDALRRASAVAPDHPVVYSHLAGVLLEEHQTDEAIAAYRQALRVAPSSAADHANLGLALAQTGRTEEAIAQYRWALRVYPERVEWLADLAWIRATAREDRFRDGPEALHLAQEACRLSKFRDPVSIRSLAAAQAAIGRFDDAQATAKRAAQLFAVTKQPNLATGIEEQLRRYENGKLFLSGDPPRIVPYTAPAGLE